nr:hypothetical protein [Tanacetum cinerariifolium]
MVAFLSKPTESDGFEQIVDFPKAHPIRYAFVNPTIYISCIKQFWSTAMAKTINGEVQLHAKVDGKKIIVTESSVRRDLRLADEEGIDFLPNSTIFEQIALMGHENLSQKLTFNWMKVQQFPLIPNTYTPLFNHHHLNLKRHKNLAQSSGPTESVADEAVHKELDDSLVRDTTTASSLEAEQDSDNLTKTQSKTTPNESSSQGTNSGGGPRCQETMRDTTPKTRFKSVSKHSNDSLLARGNTLQSDENRMKLDELIALCTNLQNIVLDLEKTKTTQRNDIVSLKMRVKKFEKRNRSRTHGLKRLYKVGLTARVESSDDEESLGQNENIVEEVVDAAQVSTAATTVTITTKEITLAQALKVLKTLKPKVKWIVFQEPGKEKRAGEELIQKITKKQKVEDDKEKDELKQLMETSLDKEEVAIDAIPLAVKSSRIVDWKIRKEGKKSYYQIVRVDEKSQMYMIFSQVLKIFDREDLEDLYKLVKFRYGSTRPVESMAYLLWSDMKIMFEPRMEDEIYMLVEKKYPLTPPILSMMLEKKLQIDYGSEMAYQLCKLIKK